MSYVVPKYLCTEIHQFLLILEREGEKERENIDLLFYTFMCYWLILVCALAGIEPTALAYRVNTLTNQSIWPGLK